MKLPGRTLLFVLILSASLCVRTSFASEMDESGLLDRGYRTLCRVYEECLKRKVGFSSCLKKKAIAFFDRLGRIDSLPVAENVELVRSNPERLSKPEFESEIENGDLREPSDQELETLGRTVAGSREEVLNDLLLERLTTLLNGFDVHIRLPKTTSSDLKRGLEEGRGKMKKMMGMMMMGLAMKMAALIPLAIGVLFLLAGKALIVSKIALVLSLIIGLKKLLSQKQSGHDVHHGGWQQGGGGGGGWDRSMKSINLLEPEVQLAGGDQEFAQSLAYNARNTDVQL